MIERIPSYCTLCRSRCGCTYVIEDGWLGAVEPSPPERSGDYLPIGVRPARRGSPSLYARTGRGDHVAQRGRGRRFQRALLRIAQARLPLLDRGRSAYQCHGDGACNRNALCLDRRLRQGRRQPLARPAAHAERERLRSARFIQEVRPIVRRVECVGLQRV
jgi:hypothetical protein